MAKPKSVSRSGRPSEISVGANEGEEPRRRVRARRGIARVAFRSGTRARAGYRQAAADHAEPIALKVDDRRAAVARIERRLDLNQAAELPSTQLECSIKTRPHAHD